MYRIDLETYSECNLKKLGPYKYAEHPSTEILCACISDGVKYLIWVNPKYGISEPGAQEMLRKAATKGSITSAFNTPFEFAVLKYLAKKTFGFEFECEWRDTAAIARAAGLPWNLKDLALTLGTTQKDEVGERLINLLCKPTAKGRILPTSVTDEFQSLCEYCKQDVRAESAIADKLVTFEFKGEMAEAFQYDFRLNSTGLPINLSALKNAQRMIEETHMTVGVAFTELTKRAIIELHGDTGDVDGYKASQRDKVLKLLVEMGLEISNLQAETIKEFLEDDTVVERFPLACDILDLYSQLSHAAAKKVLTMMDCANLDNRVRGGFLFYGAGTGRYSGQRVQPQNFKKPSFKDGDLAYKLICNNDMESLQVLYGHPIAAIASVIRNFIHSPSGDLVVADYAAIECRVLAWIAGQSDILDIFTSGGDVYKYMASKIYGKSPDSITDDERQLGKQAVLGCGYNMGWEKFKATCAKYKIYISDDLAKTVVDTYRQTNNMIVQMWREIDSTVFSVIVDGLPRTVRGMRFSKAIEAGIEYLFITLPSGRRLAYPKPAIELVTRFGQSRESITYWGRDSFTKRWTRIVTYGGKIVENIVQAIAADLMLHGALVCERNGFKAFALVHDELVAEHTGHPLMKHKKGYMYCPALEASMEDLPAWAFGLPLKAESKVMPYYRK